MTRGVLLVLALAFAAPARAAGADPHVLVLGIAQDGGVPHAGCERACCTSGRRALVTSLAVVDPAAKLAWLFECTPDFPAQLRALRRAAPGCSLAGVFLTHAHIGHYAGLVHLGREVMGAKGVTVHAMPRMREFLRGNGPWSQLVSLGNITLAPLAADSATRLGDRITVTPFRVPHRDEFSETVGFEIAGPARRIAFLPDIDKWEKWDRPIERLLERVDLAYLDGTFHADGELPGRSMAEVPHPFVVESLARFAPLPPAIRARARFIHLNHTNPALVPGSAADRAIRRAGCSVAREGEREIL